MSILKNHLNNSQTFQYGKLNLFDPATNTIAVLTDVNENNFRDIIEAALKTIFHVTDYTSVRFIFNNSLVYFNEIKFNDFKDLEHGHIFNLLI